MPPEDNQVPQRFRPILQQIVVRIAAGDYNGLAQEFTPHAQDPLYDLGMWAREYPATFMPLPPVAWQHAHAFYIRERDEWIVELDLWSVEEGLSDMTLQTYIRERDGQIHVEIAALHVM